MTPAWFSVLEAVHGSSRSPAALAGDFGLLVTAGLAAGLGMATPVMALATALALYVGRTYVDRCSIETQGVLWYPARAIVPVSLVALAAVPGHQLVGVGATAPVRFGLLALGALTLLRAGTWWVLGATRRRGIGLHPTLILGRGRSAEIIQAKLAEYREAGLSPVARFLFADEASLESLPRDVTAVGATHVVLVPETDDDTVVAHAMQRCEGLGPYFVLLPPMAELFLHPGHVNQVGGVPLIPLGRAQQRGVQPGKRLFDLAFAGLGLALLFPLLALVALAVKLGDRGPVLYRQRRVGYGGRTFDMLKFRSMVEGADRMIIDLRERNAADGLLFKVRDDPRVTRLGRLIRRTSIDELPQLCNVLRGDMSMVGPRPLAVEPSAFRAIDNERHRILPGITGYWQLSGGNGLTYEEMVKLDLAYIQNWSLWLDVRLLLRTVPALLYRRGLC